MFFESLVMVYVSAVETSVFMKKVSHREEPRPWGTEKHVDPLVIEYQARIRCLPAWWAIFCWHLP